MTNSDLVLGVDGGGTKTVACLAELSPTGVVQVLGRGQAGSSNIKAVGEEAALTNLRTALDAAWNDACCEPRTVAAAVFGLSGAGRPETQATVANWCHTHTIAEKTSVVHDALPVLIAGTPAGQGVALIAGTGAVAYAVNEQNETDVVGGWGYWFGDEGSAFWIGQAAARAVAHSADGRGPSTMLSELLLDRLQVRQPREILSALADQGDVRTALAALADLVTHAADQRDGVARKIVATAAHELALLVTSAAAKARLGSEFPLAIAGGVLCGSPVVRNAMLDALGDRIKVHVRLVEDPVDGCLRLAAQAAAG